MRVVRLSIAAGLAASILAATVAPTAALRLVTTRYTDTIAFATASSAVTGPGVYRFAAVSVVSRRTLDPKVGLWRDGRRLASFEYVEIWFDASMTAHTLVDVFGPAYVSQAFVDDGVTLTAIDAQFLVGSTWHRLQATVPLTTVIHSSGDTTWSFPPPDGLSPTLTRCSTFERRGVATVYLDSVAYGPAGSSYAFGGRVTCDGTEIVR